MLEGEVDHLFRFNLILRHHQCHVRQWGDETDVEDTLVGLTISADKSTAVDAEEDVQVLTVDIMQ